jgi:hypothetical protein
MKSIITLLSSLVVTAGYSQKETCNWYFGSQSAVSFCTGSPVNMGGSSMIQYEGCASVSNMNGDLLFYTNGVTVYNKWNQVMMNGTGLMGHQSSTHSALIVPNPANASRYYIFTADAGAYENPPNDGFRYSEVDITLDNGNGAVITATKNTLLMDSCTEKIAATLHANGTDYWVVTHRWHSNAFYAYRLSASGISAPVISAAGSVHSGNDDNTIGQMKFNPQGNKLALAVYLDGFYELFDFDKTTGAIINPVQLTIPTNISCYGVEFSPSGSLLYVTTAFFGAVFQFDISSGNAQQIQASLVQVGLSAVINGSLQLAMDGKIYLAHDNTLTQGHQHLSVINNPDAAGLACDFNYNAFYLGNGKSLLGLPSFPSHYFLPLGVNGGTPSHQDLHYYYKNGRLRVQWYAAGSETVQIIICDLSGRATVKEQHHQNRGLNSLCVPYSTTGLSLFYIKGSDFMLPGKFVVTEN